METFGVSVGGGSEDTAPAVREEDATIAGAAGAPRGRHWRVPFGAPPFV